jgi:CHAD domain-containing protein
VRKSGEVLRLLNAVREFVLADDVRAAHDGVLTIEDARFSIAASGKSRTVRRTWLDTFDWRLFRAGMTLELQAGRGTAQLVLTGRDGEPVAAEPSGLRASGARAGTASSPDGSPEVSSLKWPCLVAELPVGPLREALAPVAGVRALLPVARATSALADLRAVNADDKTIAVVTVDHMTVTQPRRVVTPARISVGALRGYQAQAVRLADALAEAPGVTAAVHSAFDSALSAAGRRPGDYSSKIDVQLSADMPAALALTTVLLRLFDTAQANVAGTIRDLDIEFLHDLRIAVRRTRSVLKLAGKALPDSVVGRYRPEFKWLGDLTTPTRDLDVYLLGYDSMARTLVAATEAELHPFHEHLARQRSASQHQLARGLRSAHFTSLAGQWRGDLEQIGRSPARRPATGVFAARRIARAHQRVLSWGVAIDQNSRPEALHELRKRCKELRYMLEVFASLHDPAEQWRAVNELKALQDCLGEFQDTEVQQTELRDFAAAMMAERSAPADTLLAMGEIAAALAVRQRAARGEFAGRFAEFSSPRGQARIEVLTEAAAS